MAVGRPCLTFDIPTEEASVGGITLQSTRKGAHAPGKGRVRPPARRTHQTGRTRAARPPPWDTGSRPPPPSRGLGPRVPALRVPPATPPPRCPWRSSGSGRQVRPCASPAGGGGCLGRCAVTSCPPSHETLASSLAHSRGLPSTYAPTQPLPSCARNRAQGLRWAGAQAGRPPSTRPRGRGRSGGQATFLCGRPAWAAWAACAAWAGRRPRHR